MSDLIIDAKNLAESTSRAQEAIKTASYPSGLEQAITARLMESPFSDHFVAVRSSGTDEDSASHSFAGKMACQILCVSCFVAGQFETYLFQKGEQIILDAIKKCWASCFASRVMQHRIDCGLSTSNMQMAVVIQVIKSGIAYSYPI